MALVLTNPFSQAMSVVMTYVESLTPSSGAGGVAPETLQPFEQKIIPNAIDYLRSKGLAIGPHGGGNYAGALGVSFLRGGVTSFGFAGARTAAPGDGGQYGLFYRALALGEAAGSEAWIYGLQQNSAARSNVAVATIGQSSSPTTVRIDVYNGDTGQLVGSTSTFTLAPGGWAQVSGILSSFGISNGYAHVVRVSGSDSIVAYGVVNDGATPSSGATNDGSYIGFSNQ